MNFFKTAAYIICFVSLVSCRALTCTAEHAGVEANGARTVEVIERSSNAADDAARFFSRGEAVEIKTAENGRYLYRGQEFEDISSIPVRSSERILYNGELTNTVAESFLQKGVNFIYNKDVLAEQGPKHFQVIIPISENIETVKKLYEVDNKGAKRIIEQAKPLMNNKNVIKVNSYEEMIEMQDEAIKNHDIPVLIFHNNSEAISKVESRINSQTNVISCNYFEDNESSLRTVGLIDFEGVVTSVNQGVANGSLAGFYDDLVGSYSNFMKKLKRKKVLVCVGVTAGAATVTGGGVYLICYYDNEK
jgi:hypothetical protein